MRILFLTDNFPPEVNAPACRTFEHCREWVQQGMKVTVITCAPNFPQGKVYEGYKNKLYRKEEMEGITVIRVWSYITANEGFMKRVLDYVSYAMMATLTALFQRFDVIIATSPQFFTAVGGYAVSVLKRRPWIMEVRDLWPESIKAVGAMKAGRMYRFLEKTELFLYKKAKKVVVVTDSFKENLAQRGIAPEKIVIVKNGVLLDQYQPIEKDIALVRSLGLEGKFVVTYLGTHGMSHALDFIIRSARQLPSNVCVLFIGDGAEKDKLLALKQELQADNVHLLPSVPKADIGSYISLSDVALVNLRKSDTFKSVIPSKIFENAAMMKPILLGVEGESKAIIEKYNAGVCFEPENMTAFHEALAKIMNPESYKTFQQGCIDLAQDFDRKNLAMKMLHEILFVS